MEEINLNSKEIDFDYAHRIPLHESKCFNLHGHRGTIIAELTGNLIEEGPQTGMILDYSIIKQLLMENVDATCDHGLILSREDYQFMRLAFLDNYNIKSIEIDEIMRKQKFWSGKTIFGKTYIIYGYPTAENIAKHFWQILAPKVLEKTNGKARLSAITFKETPSSTAMYRVKE